MTVALEQPPSVDLGQPTQPLGLDRFIASFSSEKVSRTRASGNLAEAVCVHAAAGILHRDDRVPAPPTQDDPDAFAAGASLRVLVGGVGDEFVQYGVRGALVVGPKEPRLPSCGCQAKLDPWRYSRLGCNRE